MVYALFIGDPHVQGRSEYAKRTDTGFTDQHLIHLATLLWMAKLIQHYKPTWVIVMGDTFEVPGLVEADDMSIAWRGFNAIWEACEEVGAKYKILVGNHDIHIGEGVEVHVHSISILQGPFSNSVVSAPQIDRDASGNSAYFIPYSSDSEWVKSQLLLAESLGCKFAATHVDAAGMMLNASSRATSGLNPDDIQRLWVFNGHHHYPERRNFNWIHTGSPTYQSFRDNVVSLPRGPVLWDGGNHVEWVENPHTDIYHTLLSPSEDEILEFLETVDSSRLRLRIKTSDVTYNPPSWIESRVKSFKKSYSPPTVKVDRKNVLSTQAAVEPGVALNEYLRRFPVSGAAEKIIRDELQKHISKTTSYRNVRFHFVRGKNFLSFESFHLSLHELSAFFLTGSTLDQAGVGSNGSGKTTLVESIQYALFGAINRKSFSGSDFVREGSDRCEVTLEFSVDGQIYQVVRGQDRKSGGFLNFFADSKPRNARTIAGNQKQIVDAIGFTHLDFSQMAYLNEDKPFCDLSDSDKKTLIESVAGAPIFALTFTEVDKEWKKFNRTRVVEAANSHHVKCQSEYEYFMRNTYISESASEQKKEQLKVAIVEEENKAAACRDAIASLTTAISKFIVPDVSSELQKLNKSISQLSDYVSKLQAKLNILRLERQTSEFRLTTLRSKSTGVCPTCSQVTCLTDHEQLELNELEADHPLTSQSLLTVEAEVVATQDKLKQLEIKRNGFFTESQALQSKLSELKHRRIIYDSDMSRADANASAYRNQLANFNDILKRLEAEKARLFTALQEAELSYVEMKQQEDAYKEALEVLGSEGIRAYLVDQVITVLNEVMSDVALAFGGAFQVAMSPETKRTSSTIQKISLRTMPRDYHKLSTGQKKRIDLIIHLSLARLASIYKGTVSLLVMDEVEFGLDYVGVQHLAEYLRGLGKTVFFVSQNQKLQSLFDKTFVVQYKNQISQLVSSEGE